MPPTTAAPLDLNDPQTDPLAGLSESELCTLASLLRYFPSQYSSSSKTNHTRTRNPNPNGTATLPLSFLNAQHSFISGPNFPGNLFSHAARAHAPVQDRERERELARSASGCEQGVAGAGDGGVTAVGVVGRFLRGLFVGNPPNPWQQQQQKQSQRQGERGKGKGEGEEHDEKGKGKAQEGYEKGGKGKLELEPKLCAAHNKLDAQVICGIYGLVQREVGVRVDRMRAWLVNVSFQEHNDREGQLAWDQQFVERIGEYVERMNGIATLWLGRGEFEKYFGEGAVTRPEHRFEKVDSGCPACVLAVIGGRRELLVALRATMVARKGGKDPRGLRFVEAWVEAYGGREEARRMRAESKALMEGILWVRAVMQNWGKVQGQGRADGGRSKHRGGLPARTKMVNGVPMPQLRMRGVSGTLDPRAPDPWMFGSRFDSRFASQKIDSGEPTTQRPSHVGGIHGVETQQPSQQPVRPVTEKNPESSKAPEPSKDPKPTEEDHKPTWWVESPSSPSFSTPPANHQPPETHSSTNDDGEFIPPRANWPNTKPGVPEQQGDLLAIPRPVSAASVSVYSEHALREMPSSILSDAPSVTEYVAMQDETTDEFLSRASSGQTEWPSVPEARPEEQRDTDCIGGGGGGKTASN